MSKPRTCARLEKIRLVLARRRKDLTLVLANIHDAHNVSAIYRSCDAFGVAKVYLYYTDNSFPALSAKSSASARKWVESSRYSEAGALRAALKAEGMRVYAAACSASARVPGDCDLTLPSAIILGNEHSGVSPELGAIADEHIYIPMQGMIQSFNVSVAAAIILYEAARQRRAAGGYARPSYTEEEMTERMAAWARL